MYKYVAVLCFLLSGNLWAQQVKLEGVVRNAQGESLEMANVIAFKHNTTELQSYSITDAKGKYKLHLTQNQKYTIRISFVGYANLEVDLDIDDSGVDVTKDFIIKEDQESLDEVELTYEMPVKIIGDTIVYNSDSFTTGSEKKLEDILEKLPGIEIDENGEIEVEGKKVQKVLVEGKTFFDGDSKLASQNIPANAVDKVQVLKNYNEVASMRNVRNNEDNIAINIKLKQGKDRFWFGEVKAGGGMAESQGKYLAKPKLFYYSPKKSINVLADFNNIGIPPFTRRDYFRFTGGLRNPIGNSGTMFNLTTDDMGFLTAQNNRAVEIVSNFAAVNFSNNISDEWLINGFALGNFSETDMLKTSRTVYNSTGIVDVRREDVTQKSELGMFKFKTVYEPHKNLFLDFHLFAKVANQNELLDVTSTQRSADTYKVEQPLNINQNLNAYYTHDDKNVFSTEMQFTYAKDKPLYNSLSTEQPFDLIPTIGQEDGQFLFDMTQNRKLTSSKFDARVDYYYLLTPKSNINLTVGTTLTKQQFKSNIVQTLGNWVDIAFDETHLNNDVDFYFYDYFAALHYKFVKGILTLEPGLSLHHYTVKDKQLGIENTNNQLQLLPELYARLQFKSSESLRFNYNIRSRFTDVPNFAEGYVYSNYTALRKGNRYLDNAMYHNYTLSYFNFSMFSFTNINGQVRYSKRFDEIKSKTEILGIDRISYPINSDFADENLTAFFRFSKTFKNVKTNASANMNHSIFHNNVNDDWVKSKSFSHSYRASVASNFRNAPNLELGYQVSFSDYSQTGSTTQRPFINIDVPFLKAFILTSDFSYFHYDNDEDSYTNEYSFLNASLFYQKPKSPWEFELSGTNLTNNQSMNTDSYNEITDSNNTTLYYIQPRMLMLSVKFNL